MSGDICALCDCEIIGERVEAPAISRGHWACAACVTEERKTGLAELGEWIAVFGPDLTVREMARLMSKGAV